jgi:hypothetical protein
MLTDPMSLSQLSGLYCALQAVRIPSKDSKMSKQGTSGKREHVTVTIYQKLEIIRRLECGKSISVVMASHNI